VKCVVELFQNAELFEKVSRPDLREMGIRRQARESALQALFMVDFNDLWLNFSADVFYDSFGGDERTKVFSDLLIQGVIKNQAKLDSVITRASENWSIQRMARVDRAILRVACYELCCLPEVPRNVTINEAIEISKKFGSEDSPMFMNGVLDKIASYIDTINAVDFDEEKEEVEPSKVRA